MFFNTIDKNRILSKISEFTLTSVSSSYLVSTFLHNRIYVYCHLGFNVTNVCVYISVRRDDHCSDEADCAGFDCTHNPKGHVQFCNKDPGAHSHAHAAHVGICDCKHDAGHHHH